MLEKNCGVYMVTCVENGRRYIGSSVDIARRWKEHRYELNHNQHHNRHWQNAWNKYGYQAFEWTVLEGVDSIEDSVMRLREKHWLDTIHPEFNISVEAFPTRAGAKSTEEHKEKMAQGMKRAWARQSEDEREAWRQSIKDSVSNLSPEKQASRGNHHPMSEEAKNKSSESHKKFYAEHPREKQPPKPPKPYQYKYKPPIHTPEWEAGRAEREAIRVEKIRQSNLGRKRTEEQKQKTRDAANAMWADPEYRAKHREATLLAMQDPEVLQRLSDSHKGRVLPEEQKEKIREANTGRKRTPETREKLSEARRRMWAEKKANGQADEIRKKIANSKRGQKQSEETKAKKRLAQQKRREREGEG